MRAQYMPEPSGHSWPAGMNVPVPVGVIQAAVASLLIAHNAQDARGIRLQHLNNNHPDATAKDSQPPAPGTAAHGPARLDGGRAGQPISHTSTAGWPPEPLSTGK